MSTSLWKVPNGQELSILVERNKVQILLPLATGFDDIEVELISGNLPTGTRLEGDKIVGLAYEVQRDTLYTFVLRASSCGIFDDRTFKITVIGPDEPEWRTPPGLLAVGNNGLLFVLDNQLVDYNLFAQDTDLPAGDELEYFIAEGDGVLPEGLTLTPEGNIYGITEPLLSLDKRYEGGAFDTMPFGTVLDYAVLPDNGFSSFLFDSQTYDYNEITQSLRKLNRYWPFAVTVTDGDTFARREFKIYVVGDDYLRADNTIEHASTGIFTADNTHVRTPIWITPNNLGSKRANNYFTIPLQIIDNETLVGTVSYTINDVNDDGSASILPPGLELDTDSGILHGRVPYQPAVTEDYKFSITATRVESDLENISIFANFYEDVVLGAKSFKIFKIDLTDSDGINDLIALRNREILLNNRLYKVNNVDDRNEEYDVIYVNESIGPNISLILSRRGIAGTDYIFTNRLTDAESAKYRGRTIKLSAGEEYVVQSVVPYVVYEVTSSSLLDINSAITELQNEYGGTVYITESAPDTWQVSLRSTSKTRNIGNIKDSFQAFNSGTAFSVRIFKDNETRLLFDVNLTTDISQGRNIGIALFKNDFFRENMVIATNDEVAMPESTKTFNLAVIGEIDSAIEWITPTDLGSIKANLPSIFRVQASTTVPNNTMTYELVSGTLPNGMYLSPTGEIIGTANQYETEILKGLTSFDNNVIAWDGSNPGDTTFDRVFTFSIKAVDNVGIAEIIKEFTITVLDDDPKLYTDLYLKPMLKPAQRELYRLFISDTTIFTPSKIYRAVDPKFGIQTQIQMLAYAGIEAKKIEEFVAATAKNHKRRRYQIGDFRKAEAKIPGTNEVVYEVVYAEIIDPANPKKGKSKKTFKIDTQNKITADSMQYPPKDDVVKLGLGLDRIAVGNGTTVDFVYVEQGGIIVRSRDGSGLGVSVENDFEIEIRDGGTVSIVVEVTDSEPYRMRPLPAENTIKADSNAIKVSDSKDQARYLSNTQNMRSSIKAVGANEREYLPLWMRTPQENLQELGYATAIPICYCKPGQADDILLNIKNSNFDLKAIDFEVDRYIIERTEGVNIPQYILFANYQFNV